MSYSLKIHGVLVGRSQLEQRDVSSHQAWGAFRPGVGYELVEPIFGLQGAGADSQRYRRAVAALALELYDEAGNQLQASEIAISPVDGSPKDLQLRATVLDPRFWEPDVTQ